MLVAEIRAHLDQLAHLVDRLASERSSENVLDDLMGRVRSREDVRVMDTATNERRRA